MNNTQRQVVQLPEKVQIMIDENEKRYIQEEMEAEMRGFNLPIKIKKINISDMKYKDLEEMLYHFTLRSNFYSINSEGLRAGIGRNSEGLDNVPSIFFSLLRNCK